MEQILSVLEFLGNDFTSVYRITSKGEYTVKKYECNIGSIDELFLLHPLLTYGDYDNSTEVERSNVRMFKKKFADVSGWYSKDLSFWGEAICIQLSCSDQSIIDTLSALSDYPIISDEDCYLIALELEEDAWEQCIKRDFEDSIRKKFNADYCDPDEVKMHSLYNHLKEKTNTYAHVCPGGIVSIDIDRLLKELSFPPKHFKMGWW